MVAPARIALLSFACIFLACGEGESPDADGTGAEANSGSESESGLMCSPRPEFPEVYGTCSGIAHCGASDNECASPTGMDAVSGPAFCTHHCTASFECPASDCEAEPVCVIPNSGVNGLCALDCSGGRQCPTGMECIEDLNGEVVNYLCF